MRILETLARIELTDGLTVPELVEECQGHLPRNASVIAILRAVPDKFLGVVAMGAAIFMLFYHLLPNMAEVVVVQMQLVEAAAVITWYPLVSSVLFGIATYGFGFFWFSRRDF